METRILNEHKKVNWQWIKCIFNASESINYANSTSNLFHHNLLEINSMKCIHSKDTSFSESVQIGTSPTSTDIFQGHPLWPFSTAIQVKLPIQICHDSWNYSWGVGKYHLWLVANLLFPMWTESHTHLLRSKRGKGRSWPVGVGCL